MFDVTFALFSLFAEIVVMVSILFIIIIIFEWVEHDIHGRVEWMS